MSGVKAAARRPWVGVACVALAITAVMVFSTGLSAAAASAGPATIGTGELESNAGGATGLAKESTTHFTVGEGPNRAAYDPVDHDLYVPETNASQVQVFSPTNTLVGTVSIAGSHPGAAAFDPQDDYVYVTDESLDHIYLISGTTLKHTIKNKVIDGAYGLAYDPGDGVMVVANSNEANTLWISGTTIIAAISVGLDPFDVAYDPYWSEVLVTNYVSGTVTCFSAVTGDLVGTVAVGTGPTGIAFDPSTEYDYVENFLTGNVSVINGFNGGCTLDTTISGFDYPDGVTFDQASLQMYITNVGNGKVSVVTSTSIVKNYTTSKNADPVDATYDAYNDDVYVGGYGANQGTVMYVLS